MGNCKECKHWDLDTASWLANNDYGECLKIDDWNPLEGLAFITQPEQGFVGLATKGEFGCVLFEGQGDDEWEKSFYTADAIRAGMNIDGSE